VPEYIGIYLHQCYGTGHFGATTLLGGLIDSVVVRASDS